MDKNWLLKSGWLHGLFIALVAYPISAIVNKMVASYTDANLLVYTAIFLLFASIALLAVGGRGPLSKETIRRPETWVYAFLQILTTFLSILIVKYVSASEGTILYRSSVLILFVFSLLFLKQKTNKKEIIGNLMILVSFCLIIYFAEIDLKAKVSLVLIVIVRCFSQAIQKFVAETHKTNRKATTFKDDTRVTAFIMCVSSLSLLIVLITLTVIQDYFGVEISTKLPTLGQIFNWHAFLYGSITGIFIKSTSKYCEFYASKTIGSKYLMALNTMQVLVVLVIERFLSYLSIINLRHFSLIEYLAYFLVISGSALIALSGFKMTKNLAVKGKKYNSLSTYPDMNIEDTLMLDNLSKMVKSAYVKLGSDIGKLSLECDVNTTLLEDILANDLKFISKENYNIIQNSLHHISNNDALTGALNRHAIYQKIEDNISKNNAFSIYFLDLDKFKPINDTYGHEIGDKVLIEVVKRLQNISKDINVARLGGDEFVVLKSNLNPSDMLLFKDKIKDAILLPINIKGFELCLNISTSIGCARFPSDGRTKEDLLKIADTKMYDDKSTD